MPSSLRSNTHSGPAGRSAVSTAFIGVTNAGRTSAAGGRPGDDGGHGFARTRRYGVRSVAAPAPRTRAPSFELPSTTGGSVGLGELVSGGPALLIFASEECPTCALALRRLAPIVGPLRDAGVGSCGRLRGPARRRCPRRARRALQGHRAGGAGAVRHVARVRAREPADDVPARPRRVGRRDRRSDGTPARCRRSSAGPAARSARRRPTITDEPPRTKPGCAAKSTYDEEMLALDRERRRRRRDGGHVRARVDRRASGRPPHALARRRDARRPRPAAVARRGAARAWARRRSSASPRARSSPAAARSTSRSCWRRWRRRSTRPSTSTGRR